MKRAGDVTGLPQWQRDLMFGNPKAVSVNVYYVPGAKRIAGQRITISDRIRMHRARKMRERRWMV
jgi:hypothetical protein